MSFMLSVTNKPIMPSVVILSVITLSVLAPHAIHEATSRVDTNIYSYLETSGGQSCNLYLNLVHFFNTSVN